VGSDFFSGWKTMPGSIPITWNGIAPRPRDPDLLWLLLCMDLLAVSDGGDLVRWRATRATLQGQEVHVRVAGQWYEMVPPPPFWTTHQILGRLIGLTAQSWWDRCQLRLQYWRRRWRGRPLDWGRTVVLGFGADEIPAACRVRCGGSTVEITLWVAEQDERVRAMAAEVLPAFMELVPFDEMVDAFPL
jgi:hypothetical protein